ncbi:hypothetical protein B0H14DRAFT_2596714 [Mycena olivaceomarginata]|nr:hypothetical protein B0H14DRAFT_2596714 [Mycena olivaceomarginata]
MPGAGVQRRVGTDGPRLARYKTHTHSPGMNTPAYQAGGQLPPASAPAPEQAEEPQRRLGTPKRTPPCPSKQRTRVFSCTFAKLAHMLKSGSDTASVAEKENRIQNTRQQICFLLSTIESPHDTDLDGDIYAQCYATSAESPNAQRTGHILSPTILSDQHANYRKWYFAAQLNLDDTVSHTQNPGFTRLRSQTGKLPVEDKAKGGGGEYFPSRSKAERQISFFAQSLTAELPASIPSTPIDPPTISVVVHPNSSPLGGTEGTKHMLTSHTHSAPPSPPTPLPSPSPPPQFVSHALYSLPLLSHPLPPVRLSSLPYFPTSISLPPPSPPPRPTSLFIFPVTEQTPQKAEQLTCALAEERPTHLAEEELVPALELDVHTGVVNTFLWGEKGVNPLVYYPKPK